MADAVAAFGGQAVEAGIELRSSIADTLPLVDVDPVRIRGVLANLIVNALRYTPRGGTITVAAVSAEPGLVALSVDDTGDGMPSDLAARAFERFTKGSTSAGSGLGLAIVRDLVVAHGGTISLDSQPSRGTTVSFTVPVSRPGVGSER